MIESTYCHVAINGIITALNYYWFVGGRIIYNSIIAAFLLIDYNNHSIAKVPTINELAGVIMNLFKNFAYSSNYY